MSIQVICPGCHTRFKVSDKFAGQKGGCPKCKTVIQVPKANEEVILHEPDHSEFGARNAQGISTLKPLDRIETKVNPLAIVALVGVGVVAVILALAMRMNETGPPKGILYLGAIALAPPLCWLGYSFLRDDEQLEAFSGSSLWIRTALCSAGYALLWAAFAYVYWRVVGSDPVEVWHMVLLAPPFLFAGAGIAYCCYDLDLGTGFFHYALYLLVTILLRLAMGLPAVGPGDLVG